jgi:hypothetical protein
MSDLSNYLETKLYDHVLRNTAYTSPTTVYVALYTAVTDAEAGTGTEVSTAGTAYARQSVAFGVSSDGAGSNSALITFPTATAAWGTVSHAGLNDNGTAGAGNALSIIKALTGGSKVVNSGDIFRFPAGNITFSFA